MSPTTGTTTWKGRRAKRLPIAPIRYEPSSLDYIRRPLWGGLSRLFHPHRFFGLTVHLGRLPELDPVPLRVRDPSETAVWGVLDLPIDGNSFSAKAREQAVQILHAIVDHEGRAVLAEVLRVAGKDRPNGV